MFDLGMKLHDLRVKKKWTQKRVANRLNVTESAISKYECNMSVPSIDVLRSYSALFNVSMDELLGMERGGTLSLYGLTDEQSEILKQLCEVFKGMGAESAFEVIGKAAVEVAKTI